MLPTDDEIRHAAYARWQRRGRTDGGDRQDWYAAERELTFAMNYRTIVDYSLDVPGMLVLGDRPVRYCRLCERTSVHAPFSAPRPVVMGISHTSLFTEAVCDDCQASCRDPLVADFDYFWNALPTDAAPHDRAQADACAGPVHRRRPQGAGLERAPDHAGE